MAVELLGIAGLNDDSQSGSKELPFHCPAGENRKLFIGVAVATDSENSSPVTGVTYATSAVASLVDEVKFHPVTNRRVYVWYVDNADLPASAGTNMVTVSLAGSVSLQIHAAAYSGAKQGAPTNVRTHFSTSTIINELNITTTVSDSYVFSCVAAPYRGDDVISPGSDSDLTELQKKTSSGTNWLTSAIGHVLVEDPVAVKSYWEAAGPRSGQVALEIQEAVTTTTSAVGTAAGTSAAVGVGAATKTTVGIAAGTSTAIGVGYAAFSGVGAASGTSTAVAPGYGGVVGVGAAAGTSTALAPCSCAQTVCATGAGTSAAVGVGCATAFGVGTAAGTSSAVAPGYGACIGVGVAAGTSTCTGVGYATVAPRKIQRVVSRVLTGAKAGSKVLTGASIAVRVVE